MRDVVKMIKNGMFLSISFIKMEKRHNKDITERKKFWILLTECLLLVKVKIFQKYIYIYIYILKHILHTHNLRTNILSSFRFLFIKRWSIKSNLFRFYV